ncbi:MAG: hypothetical protein ACR2PR_06340 [Pseudohongiellaceae bacterium]
MKRKSTQARAATQIRLALKSMGIKARVTSTSASMMTAVDIWIKGWREMSEDARKPIQELARRYEYGTFNGMDDSFSADNVDDSIPQVKFVMISED